jgi:hypothetical protein
MDSRDLDWAYPAVHPDHPHYRGLQPAWDEVTVRERFQEIGEELQLVLGEPKSGDSKDFPQPSNRVRLSVQVFYHKTGRPISALPGGKRPTLSFPSGSDCG